MVRTAQAHAAPRGSVAAQIGAAAGRDAATGRGVPVGAACPVVKPRAIGALAAVTGALPPKAVDQLAAASEPAAAGAAAAAKTAVATKVQLQLLLENLLLQQAAALLLRESQLWWVFLLLVLTHSLSLLRLHQVELDRLMLKLLRMQLVAAVAFDAAAACVLRPCCSFFCRCDYGLWRLFLRCLWKRAPPKAQWRLIHLGAVLLQPLVDAEAAAPASCALHMLVLLRRRSLLQALHALATWGFLCLCCSTVGPAGRLKLSLAAAANTRLRAEFSRLSHLLLLVVDGPEPLAAAVTPVAVARVLLGTPVDKMAGRKGTEAADAAVALMLRKAAFLVVAAATRVPAATPATAAASCWVGGQKACLRQISRISIVAASRCARTLAWRHVRRSTSPLAMATCSLAALLPHAAARAQPMQADCTEHVLLPVQLHMLPLHRLLSLHVLLRRLGRIAKSATPVVAAEVGSLVEALPDADAEADAGSSLAAAAALSAAVGAARGRLLLQQVGLLGWHCAPGTPAVLAEQIAAAKLRVFAAVAPSAGAYAADAASAPKKFMNTSRRRRGFEKGEAVLLEAHGVLIGHFSSEL
ncbi:hypothetical protein Emed_003577 [Eimeria media]